MLADMVESRRHGVFGGLTCVFQLGVQPLGQNSFTSISIEQLLSAETIAIFFKAWASGDHDPMTWLFRSWTFFVWWHFLRSQSSCWASFSTDYVCCIFPQKYKVINLLFLIDEVYVKFSSLFGDMTTTIGRPNASAHATKLGALGIWEIINGSGLLSRAHASSPNRLRARSTRRKLRHTQFGMCA